MTYPIDISNFLSSVMDVLYRMFLVCTRGVVHADSFNVISETFPLSHCDAIVCSYYLVIQLLSLKKLCDKYGRRGDYLSLKSGSRRNMRHTSHLSISQNVK